MSRYSTGFCFSYLNGDTEEMVHQKFFTLEAAKEAAKEAMVLTRWYDPPAIHIRECLMNPQTWVVKP